MTDRMREPFIVNPGAPVPTFSCSVCEVLILGGVQTEHEKTDQHLAAKARKEATC